MKLHREKALPDARPTLLRELQDDVARRQAAADAFPLTEQSWRALKARDELMAAQEALAAEARRVQAEEAAATRAAIAALRPEFTRLLHEQLASLAPYMEVTRRLLELWRKQPQAFPCPLIAGLSPENDARVYPALDAYRDHMKQAGLL